ncbi:MAG: MiaB/RimO family radical SAM methylthiotransferase [Endomicrobiia bacterium]|nr:MiaB/RimO family radical SAM methylthiotransferase [Endomicrobiia bacterium]
MKVYIEVLGCAKNLVEAETLAGRLAARGVEFAPDVSRADAVVVHTCAFIGDALSESSTAIRNIARKSRRGTKIIVSGCIAQMSALENPPPKAMKSLALADFVVGTGRLEDIPDIIMGQPSGKNAASARMVSAPGGFHDAASRVHPAGRPWAYVRIAEGCDHRCNYCLIPSLRGGYKSRPADDIIAEATRLAARGVKEINLISQDTSGYGLDIGRNAGGIVGLLKRLEKIRGVEWLRLLYCHPATISDGLIERMAVSEKIVRYLDVPFQHIADAPLRAMGRPQNGAALRSLVEKLKLRVPGIALRTTFIVGHPGERERDFSELLDFVREGHFMWTGVFAYSKMPGTASAASRSASLPAATVRLRYRELSDAARRANLLALERFAAKKVMSLVVEPGLARAYFCAPEVDAELTLAESSAIGSFVSVKCRSVVRRG